MPTVRNGAHAPDPSMPEHRWQTGGAPPRLAILASGRGSNAVALMEGFASGFIPGILAGVLSNKADAPVLQKATTSGVPIRVVESRDKTREEHETALLTTLAEMDVGIVLLAGYMRILSPFFLRRFAGHILNIHPSLLPDFPGLYAAERQWEAGMRVAGATVHAVDEGVDTGPILLQGSLVVRGDEGPDGLAQRILHEVEHVIYPRAVRLFLDRLARQQSVQDKTQEEAEQ